MTDRNKIKLVQAAVGAVVLTLLMQLMGVFGYFEYTWMCFLPLLLFFAFGAQFKMIASMVISFAVGEVWCLVNGVVMGVFQDAFGADNMVLGVILPTILVIFAILTVHENLFEGAIFSNVPCIFMGMATSFFMTEMGANPDPMQLVKNFCFWCFGMFLAVALVLSGMFVCTKIFGQERTMAALMPKPKDEPLAQDVPVQE